jgi:hypothetical protein
VFVIPKKGPKKGPIVETAAGEGKRGKPETPAGVLTD